MRSRFRPLPFRSFSSLLLAPAYAKNNKQHLVVWPPLTVPLSLSPPLPSALCFCYANFVPCFRNTRAERESKKTKTKTKKEQIQFVLLFFWICLEFYCRAAASSEVFARRSPFNPLLPPHKHNCTSIKNLRAINWNKYANEDSVKITYIIICK